jgi:hypothetical protein
MAVDAMQPGALVQRWQVVMFDPFSTLPHFVHILLRRNPAQSPMFVPVLVLVLCAPPFPPLGLGSVCRLMAGFEISW